MQIYLCQKTALVIICSRYVIKMLGHKNNFHNFYLYNFAKVTGIMAVVTVKLIITVCGVMLWFVHITFSYVTLWFWFMHA